MPPKFSLQSVLDFRHLRVEIIEVELGRLFQTQLHGKAFLDALHSSQSRILYQLGEIQNGEIDMFLISRLHANLDTVNLRIAQQETRLKELAEQIDLKKQELVIAKQDDKALETLKDHEIERYQLEQARLENSLQDDIYIYRAYRRSNSVA
jgi:flagellar export protein FliJ